MHAFIHLRKLLLQEAYMGLERRVMALENELAQLKHMLRSV
jgi:hypothetical protein